MLRIIGGGMAGLVAAVMLSHRNPVVIEMQKAVPNNHKAVLRFRSSIVGDVVGVQFKKVTMTRSTIHWRNPVADALSYAFKATGEYSSSRSITRGDEVAERWIAPENLIARLANRVKIALNQEWTFSGDQKVISTVPMPVLMQALDYPKPWPEFKWRDGWVIRVRVGKCDAYASVLSPDPDVPFYRASVTGNLLMIEGAHWPAPPNDFESQDCWWMIREAAQLLGIDDSAIFVEDRYDVVSKQPYGKILPIDEHERRRFIHWASTVKGKAWQLGRYATWRPGLVLDDVVKDIRLIDAWIEAGGSAGYLEDEHEAIKRMRA